MRGSDQHNAQVHPATSRIVTHTRHPATPPSVTHTTAPLELTHIHLPLMTNKHSEKLSRHQNDDKHIFVIV